MGIDIQQARFLFGTREHGVCFSRLATLGRHRLMASEKQLGPWLQNYVPPHTDAQKQAVCRTSGQFAEPFWQFLGATQTTSFDASDYEGATVVHDFNQPIPTRFHSQFDAVVDSGSLEHIF